MIVCPHWQLRHHMKFFRTDGSKRRNEARFYVLMYLIMRSNQRLRCWPSVELIMEETGFKKAPVSQALAWLESKGAVYNVPADKRMGEEAKLHGNKKVWQLTGLIRIEAAIVEYLNMQPEVRAMVIDEIKQHGREDVARLFSEISSDSEPKISSQNEPNSHSDNQLGSHDELEYAKLGSQNEPKIGSQKSPEGNKEKKVTQVPEDKSAHALIPLPPEVAQIMALFTVNPPDFEDVRRALEKYPFASVKAAVQKATSKQGVANPWAYAKRIFEDDAKTPPGSAPPPSDNGRPAKLVVTPEQEARNKEISERIRQESEKAGLVTSRPKASGQ